MAGKARIKNEVTDRLTSLFTTQELELEEPQAESAEPEAAPEGNSWFTRSELIAIFIFALFLIKRYGHSIDTKQSTPPQPAAEVEKADAAQTNR